MKTRILLSIAALTLANAAFAHQPHALTRADVTAEYLAAKAAGTLPPSGDNYPGNGYFTSTKSRAEVVAETRLAIARGDIATGEQYPVPGQPVSGKTRAQVKQELADARRSHTVINDQQIAN